MLRQDVAQRAHRSDLDVITVKLQNLKTEQDQKITNTEKDIDEFVETMQSELTNMKNTMIQSLNKKADFSMLDRLNEMVAKKVDTELLRQSQAQHKQELMQQIDMVRGELSLERSSRDTKMNERIEKCELNGERALDEIFSYKEQLRQLQEERKRDIEETADFIKQVMETNKQEFNRDL